MSAIGKCPTTFDDHNWAEAEWLEWEESGRSLPKSMASRTTKANSAICPAVPLRASARRAGDHA